MQNISLAGILLEAFQVDKNKLIELIKNKRICSFYYKGDLEQDKRDLKTTKKKVAPELNNAPGWRRVKIVCYGRGYVNRSGHTMNNEEYIRAWQDEGPSVSYQKKGDAHREMPGWRFFKLDRISNWNLSSNQNFTTPPDNNYNPNGDKNLAHIIASADFTPNSGDTPDTLVKPAGSNGKPITPAQPGNSAEPEDKPDHPADDNPLPDKEPSQQNAPKPTAHYATARSKNVASKLKGGQHYSRIRNRDPKNIREGLMDLLIELINEMRYE